MTFLKEWTFCVCVSLTAAVILSLFTPKGRMKSFYKMLISLFIFISFIYPFRDFKGPDLDFESYFPTEKAEEQGRSTYENMVDKQIKTVLEQNGIIGAVVSSDIEVNYESGELSLKNAQIAVPDEYETDEVREVVFSSLGIDARVIHIGD